MVTTESPVTEQLKQLPASPGVYLMRDAENTILYVGKAASLRHRVSSYFTAQYKLSPKLQQLVAQVHDVDFFVTNSEQEALILELNMIKQYRPRYNVRLKDDKSFPYLKISLNEEWPKLYMTRRLEKDGGRYFGPFASAWSVRETLKVLKGIFPFRSCSKLVNRADARACLEYHMGRYVGPCTGEVSRQEYANVIKQVILFLEGKQEKIVHELENRMNKAADSLQFEKAARLRDQIQAINTVIEGQKIAARVRGDQDVIAFAQEKDRACVQVFFIRNGKLIGRESFILEGTRSEEPQQIMTSFVKQFYASSTYIPPLILLQHPVEDAEIIESWLQSKRGGKVRIQVPRRGSKKQQVNIVSENAQQGLLKLKHLTPSVIEAALEEIQKELRLPRTPLRIEGYDISNIHGTAAVGSMVVFDRGKPKPAHYRRFKIKTVSGANDYAMLQEVLKRRFKRSSDALSQDTWTILPDLVLIDGGKGQLNAARSVMEELGLNQIPIASLAKENEELFIPQKEESIVLARSSPGLQLLQRLRDEAHRFAIGYFKKVHKRETFASVLDSIPGIGPKR
ncbi:MAG: excinuclease ABC subunit UvrC, partial [Chloroflexi bacterium]|nr:excinuclease ABC subunit UvrC [Chloroflexota bacterium]